MSKLTLKDVRIKGEGAQIRKAILQRYNTIKEFYEIHSDITNKYPTLLSYLSRDIIVSDSFKYKMTVILDTDYPSIFVTRQHQIKKHAQNIYENINRYDKESDHRIFDYLIEHCKKEELETELAMMYRAKARTYYNTNRLNHFVEYYEYALEVLPKIHINKLVFFQCELADCLLRNNSIVKANDRFRHAGKLVHLHKDRLNNDTLFYYYYWRGIAYIHGGDYSDAREFFVESVAYADKNCKKASAIANIGLVYKKQGRYDEALEYYMDALNYYDESNVITTAAIYNNTAEAYKCKKEYENGIMYVDKALEIAEKEKNLGKRLIYVATKAEIQLEMGKKEAYKIYFALLLNTKAKSVQSRPYILDSIRTSIKNINNIPCLKELSRIIIKLMDASSSEDYIRGLSECEGLISYKTTKLSKGCLK